MKKLISTLLLFSLVSVSFAQKKTLFKLAPAGNNPIKYESINKMDIEGPQTVIMDMVMHMNTSYNTFQDSLVNVVAKYTYAKIDLDAGMMTASFDSSKEPTNEMEKMLATQFKPLLENELTYSMNKFGQIKDIDFPNVSAQIFDKSSVRSFGVVYPTHPIAIGDSWTAQNKQEQLGILSKAKYTLIDKNSEGYKIDCDINIVDQSDKTIGTSKGYFIVDPNTFITISSSTKTDLEMQGTKVSTNAEMRIIK